MEKLRICCTKGSHRSAEKLTKAKNERGDCIQISMGKIDSAAADGTTVTGYNLDNFSNHRKIYGCTNPNNL